MALAAGVSESTVGRIWKRHGLKPHRVVGFKISNDPRLNMVERFFRDVTENRIRRGGSLRP